MPKKPTPPLTPTSREWVAKTTEAAVAAAIDDDPVLQTTSLILSGHNGIADKQIQAQYGDYLSDPSIVTNSDFARGVLSAVKALHEAGLSSEQIPHEGLKDTIFSLNAATARYIETQVTVDEVQLSEIFTLNQDMGSQDA